jgi:hypothetical protein
MQHLTAVETLARTMLCVSVQVTLDDMWCLDLVKLDGEGEHSFVACASPLPPPTPTHTLWDPIP